MGAYASSSSTFEITAGAGPLVLDGGSDSSSVFIFEMNADDTLALNSITVSDGANIEGRLLARNGNVTFNNDNITVPVWGHGQTVVSSLLEYG